MNELLKFIVKNPRLTEKELKALVPNVDVAAELARLRQGAYIIKTGDDRYMPTATGVSKGQ